MYLASGRAQGKPPEWWPLPVFSRTDAAGAYGCLVRGAFGPASEDAFEKYDNVEQEDPKGR